MHTEVLMVNTRGNSQQEQPRAPLQLERVPVAFRLLLWTQAWDLFWLATLRVRLGVEAVFLALPIMASQVAVAPGSRFLSCMGSHLMWYHGSCDAQQLNCGRSGLAHVQHKR
jgi:hypothetical protein